MRSWFTVVGAMLVGTTLGCAQAKTETPSPSPRPEGNRAPGGELREGPPPAGRRREPPKPETQDSVRQANLADVFKSIAGRENEPAGKVFKNVQLNKEMPAKAFLTMMDEQYGRGLGNVCSGCHANTNVGGVIIIDYASDQPKNKIIARKMEAMQQSINKALKKNTDLDEDYPKSSCVMCHRGTSHMPNAMKQPKNTDPLPPTRQRG